MRPISLILIVGLCAFVTALSVRGWQRQYHSPQDIHYSQYTGNGFNINSEPVSASRISTVGNAVYSHPNEHSYPVQQVLSSEQIIHQSAPSYHMFHPASHSFTGQSANHHVQGYPAHAADTSHFSELHMNDVQQQSMSQAAVIRGSDTTHVDLGNGDFLITGDIIALKLDNSMYVKRYYPFPSYSYSGALAYQTSIDPYSKFSVETVDSEHIYLKAENGQYLKRFCCWGGMSVIAIYLDRPDPYSIFKVIPADNGKVRLQAENGYYLKRYFGWDGKNVLAVLNVKDQYGLFDVEFVDRPTYRESVYVNSNLTLYNEDVIAIKLDNSMYVKRFYPFPSNTYSGALAYQTYIDPYSNFMVEIVDSNHIYLKAENGQYLKRFCCWNGMSVIAMYLNKPDPYSIFKVIPADNGKVRLQAENGYYLKRFYGWSGKNVLVVVDVQDQYGLFDIEKL